MKIAIVGSRSFNDYSKVEESLNEYKGVATLVVSGGARGADSLGARWANENSVPTKIFMPDWDKFGKSAGYRRNVDIVKESDVVIAFWDGASKGTKHSIDLAEQLGKELIIVRYV